MASEAIAEELAKIEHVSAARNTSLAITGALLLNSRQFAQVMEGPLQSLNDVMTLISADTRHSNVVVIDRRPISQALFTGWSIVYKGQSSFISRLLADCLAVPVRRDSRSNLCEAFEEFAKG